MTLQRDVDDAIARGNALVHVALQESILEAAAEFQALAPQLDEFIEACSKAEIVAPFFDPSLYLKNRAAGDPLEAMKELAVLAKKLGARLPTTCRMCGCTTDRACDGGCSWVAPALCSSCRP